MPSARDHTEVMPNIFGHHSLVVAKVGATSLSSSRCDTIRRFPTPMYCSAAGGICCCVGGTSLIIPCSANSNRVVCRWRRTGCIRCCYRVSCTYSRILCRSSDLRRIISCASAARTACLQWWRYLPVRLSTSVNSRRCLSRAPSGGVLAAAPPPICVVLPFPLSFHELHCSSAPTHLLHKSKALLETFLSSVQFC